MDLVIEYRRRAEECRHPERAVEGRVATLIGFLFGGLTLSRASVISHGRVAFSHTVVVDCKSQ